jgi:PKHD-type hydroxylase
MTIRSTLNYLYVDGEMNTWLPRIKMLAPRIEQADTSDFDSTNYRESSIGWIPGDLPNAQPLFEELWDKISHANVQAGWNFTLSNLEPLQYTVYDSNQHYGWHVDVDLNNVSEFQRKLSFSLLLSDDYEGGELQIEGGSPSTEERVKTVPLKRGDMVVFPSYVWHRVTPVTRGRRISLVGWVDGPPFY